MKKKIATILLGLTVVLSIVACGNKDNSIEVEEGIIMEDSEEMSTNSSINMTSEEISDILSNITEENAEFYGYCNITDECSMIDDDEGNIVFSSKADVNDAMYYYKDHILVIKGHGAASHEWREIKGFDYEKEIEVVIIDEGITMLEYASFRDCSNLKYVHFPSTLGIIQGELFSECKKLSNVTLPENLYGIYNRAFSGCSSLTEIDIPDTTLVIGDSAFSRCYSLQRVKLPRSVKTYYNFSYGPFQSCSNLSEVEIPDSLEYMSDNIFTYCTNIKKVKLGEIEFTDIQKLNIYLYDNQLSDSQMTFPISAN